MSTEHFLCSDINTIRVSTLKVDTIETSNSLNISNIQVDNITSLDTINSSNVNTVISSLTGDPYLTKSSPPCWYARFAGNQLIDASEHDITLSSGHPSVDSWGGRHDSSVAKYQVPVAGYYKITLDYTPTSSNTNVAAKIVKQNSSNSTNISTTHWALAYNNSYNGTSLSWIEYAEVNEWFVGFGVDANGSNWTMHGGGWSGMYIG